MKKMKIFVLLFNVKYFFSPKKKIFRVGGKNRVGGVTLFPYAQSYTLNLDNISEYGFSLFNLICINR